MKKIVIFAALSVVIIAAIIIVAVYLKIPVHVKTGDPEMQVTNRTYSAFQIDEQVKSAIEAGEAYILDDEGIDVPYSDDLLRTVGNHFNTKMEYIGAGVYWGAITEHTAVELLLNSKGNVGQVQLCIIESVNELELSEVISRYVQFLNTNLSTEAVEMVVQEVMPDLKELSNSSGPYLYYENGVGFSAKEDNNKLYIAIP